VAERPEAPAVSIRPAVAAELARLRALAAASKGYWGYEAELVASWAAGLDPFARPGWAVFAAECGGLLSGWMALAAPRDGTCVLEQLWVDPALIRGSGVGSALYRYACTRALLLGATCLECESDPNAIGFYERMGAKTSGERRSEWGRMLPVMRLALAPPARDPAAPGEHRRDRDGRR
jgi:ribosomal protein S18 acetylase RimI-like enzyme